MRDTSGSYDTGIEMERKQDSLSEIGTLQERIWEMAQQGDKIPEAGRRRPRMASVLFGQRTAC